MKFFNTLIFKKAFVFILIFSSLIYYLIILNAKKLLPNLKIIDKESKTGRYNEVASPSMFNLKKMCDKWIIVTTINHPTNDLKYLNDASYGWCLLVVGDKKTPKDWKYKMAIYLSIDDQLKMALKYRIVNLIPFGSYLRKVLGYLYAIENNAKFIYETDDDNSPLIGLFGFRYENFKGLESSCGEDKEKRNHLIINPYAYFGQPTIWPRGFPIELIANLNPSFDNCKSYIIYRDRVPLIQQGLVNGDPDLDAIYRLTRKNHNVLKLQFDSNAPPLVLNKHQYAPINSQNTFFHYDAFFSLIFPLNATFRECAILRGYISIKLLQYINGRVSFMPPNAFQKRNPHSYHKDYLEENRLYETIFSFIKVLDRWECMKATLKECLIDCIDYLVELKYLSNSEVEFYRFWVEALDQIGYNWPKIVRHSEKANEDTPTEIFYKAIEQIQSSNAKEFSILQINDKFKKLNKLETECGLKIDKEIELCKIDKMIFVTMANNLSDFDYISSIINIHFEYVVICVNNSFNSKDTFFNNYLLNSTGLMFIILKKKEHFKDCLDKVFLVGFKQQAFLIAKSYLNFKFASISFQSDESLSIESLNDQSFNNNVFYLRKNVANGIKLVKFENSSGFHFKSSICSYYLNERPSQICDLISHSIEANLNWHQNDLASEYCQDLKKRTIWIPDFHDRSRVDISSTLVHLGQNPILAGVKLHYSLYPEAFNLSKVSYELSNFIKNYSILSQYELNGEILRENFNFYQKSKAFQQVDAVICSFPSSLCEGFIPLNKTLIFNPIHRYNIGRCTKSSWEQLNQNYIKLKAKNKLVISASNKYDEEYQAHFTGLRDIRLFGYGGFYAKNIKYTPNSSIILVGPTSHLGSYGLQLYEQLCAYTQNLTSFDFEFKLIRQIYSRYNLNQLAHHPAIVIFPNAACSFSIIDFYISNIPIFVPSIDILTKYKNVDDRTIRHSSYCGEDTYEIEPHQETIHKFSPNNQTDDDSYRYWLLNYADYYMWPHVNVFNSWEDLINKLKKLDLYEISSNMKRFNEYRETDLLENWCKLLKRLPSESNIPKSYEEAMKFFNINL